MHRNDLLRLIGAQQGSADYIPVALMIRSGYAVAGYYNEQVNQGMEQTMILLNARLVELEEPAEPSLVRHRIRDFNEFLEDIVQRHYTSADSAVIPESDVYGKSIPLAAVDMADITVVYPVAKIGELMKQSESDGSKVPSFLDFDNRSVILKVLRTKVW